MALKSVTHSRAHDQQHPYQLGDLERHLTLESAHALPTGLVKMQILIP